MGMEFGEEKWLLFCCVLARSGACVDLECSDRQHWSFMGWINEVLYDRIRVKPGNAGWSLYTCISIVRMQKYRNVERSLKKTGLICLFLENHQSLPSPEWELLKQIRLHQQHQAPPCQVRQWNQIFDPSILLPASAAGPDKSLTLPAFPLPSLRSSRSSLGDLPPAVWDLHSYANNAIIGGRAAYLAKLDPAMNRPR